MYRAVMEWAEHSKKGCYPMQSSKAWKCEKEKIDKKMRVRVG